MVAEGEMSPGGLPSPPRQRGYYSEVLDEDKSSDLLASAMSGPRSKLLQPKLAAPRQPIPAGSRSAAAAVARTHAHRYRAASCAARSFAVREHDGRRDSSRA